MATVRFEGSCKRFGDVAAVSDLDLSVAEGELLVLVGPSGSGKTTALRLLAGLESLSEGHIWIDDRQVDRLPPKERDIAMVFQDYGLYPQMTVRQNMAFGLRMRKMPSREIESRIGSTARTLDLEDKLERKPAQLSGGQRQRVALGRAMVRDPQVFLMDEPLSNLDAKLRVQMRAEITRLQQEVGTTTVYVTHDQVEAMTLGHRIGVMRDSRLVHVGTPTELYDEPADTFVAGFLGTPAMRFNRTRVTPAEGAVVLEAEALRLLCRCDRELPREVVLGVRPEHVELWNEDKPMIGPIDGRVSFLEVLGGETYIGAEVADDVAFTVRVEGRFYAQIGDQVRFGLHPGGLYVFDGETERAITRL